MHTTRARHLARETTTIAITAIAILGTVTLATIASTALIKGMLAILG